MCRYGFTTILIKKKIDMFNNGVIFLMETVVKCSIEMRQRVEQ